MQPYFKCVFFDEDNGASVHEVATDELIENREAGEEIPADDDEDAWMQLVRTWDNGDCRCIMKVDDARNAALHVLEATGGLPPVKLAIESLDRARYLLSEIKAGNAYSEETLTRELGHITAALSVARELGEA